MVIEYQKEIREIHAELLTRNGEMGQLKCKNEELRDHNVRLIGSQDNDK